MTDVFWSDSPPWVHTISATSSGRLPHFMPPSGMNFVAWLDGRKMLDADGVFHEFWSTLRFPDYFGWNWDALFDCLSDLRWIQADRCLVIVEEAGRLLSGSREELEVFVATLVRAGVENANKSNAVSGGYAFNVLLIGSRSELSDIEQSAVAAHGKWV